MGFKQVFTSLQELFPQVDLRMLKAVAIEHPNDVDAAAEFILSDVLPAIIGSCKPSCTLQDTDEMQHSSTVVGKGKQPILFGHQEVEEGTANHHSGQEPVACKITVVDGYTSSAHVMSSCSGEADSRDLQVGIADYSKGLECPTLHYNASKELNATPDLEPKFMEKGIDLNSDIEDIVLHPKSHVHEKFVDAVCNMNDQVNVCLVSSSSAHDECTLEQPMMQSCIGKSKTMIDVLCDSAQKLNGLDSSVPASVVNSDVQNVPLESIEGNPDSMEIQNIMEGGSCSIIHGSEEQSVQTATQDHYELEVDDTLSDAVTSAEDIKVGGEAADSRGCGMDEVITATNEYEEPHSKLVDESVADLLSSDSGMLSANSDNLPATLVTLSGHFVNIEYLEDLISDAKNNKKKMLSAMELTTNMIREMELLEKRSKQAKEAASTAGQDILSKVGELNKILKHAKEANDMHAGEVYGEKAILATEARELQSRLLSLSDERNKSLSMIEEIGQTLEARLAATEEEIAAAEQEKLEKESLARKALNEQEAIMASVVEESKKLQQEAETNSKLREFLMDRGRMVDALQGEIAIICEDVRLLKERVDGRLPLSRSLLSSLSRSMRSTASSLVASSGSSYHRTKDSSDGVLEHEDFTEESAITKQEQHESQQPEKSNPRGDSHGASTDDGWELLKDGVMCS